MTRLRHFLLLFLPTCGLIASCDNAPPPPADRVYLNGAVYTFDEERRKVEAIAIRDGVIVFAGSSTAAARFIDEQTEVTDLAQRMLMPGFLDSHAHVLAAGLGKAGCNLEDERDPDLIREILEACAGSGDAEPDEWVTGSRWALAAFPNGRPPVAWLDEIFAGRPAYFVDSFGHSAWVSSRALHIAGIDRSTKDPEQGVIERDGRGNAIGVLRDAAMELVARHIPPATPAELAAAIRTGLADVRRFGITAYTEPGLAERHLRAYKAADEAGKLTARVFASMSPIGWDAGKFGNDIYDLIAKRDAFRGKYLNPDSIKVYIDGVIETETSFMLQPYTDGGNFPPFYAAEELAVLFQKLDAEGLQIHTHAIGDAAIRSALDAYEHAVTVNGPSDNRHQIVHLQLIDDEDIPRFGELHVAADFQCMWCYPDEYIEVAIGLVGKDRVDRFYPVAAVLKGGGLIIGGSDWDVSSLNPLDAIETAITRKNPFTNEGLELGSGQGVDLQTALEMYTRNASRVMRLDALTGSLEVGKRADLIVLDRDLFDIPTSEINEARVLQTLMDGVEVYTDKAF
ncbi:MAG: amidohydrolase [Gammaproteobacteria bacterium]|nr:amidohydrolase [Gammaproteobacteria bacterium]MDH4313883.1 amidohydrolase [Gammaproteobacteria bacterium]MDH5215023.1 amidohydrolase [Gammaproteobacteria bacterium]